jgi:hypothetical protein
VDFDAKTRPAMITNELKTSGWVGPIDDIDNDVLGAADDERRPSNVLESDEPLTSSNTDASDFSGVWLACE